jgi:hypothetical protein
MRPLALADRFRRLSPARRRLLGRALPLVPLVRLGLWLLPYGRVRRLTMVPRREPTAAASDTLTRATARPTPDEIAWAVTAVSRRVPRASCLTQALAAQRLLAQDGYASRLQIGVARNPAGTFEAHAWLECEGRIVIGEIEGLTRFTPMAPTGDAP